MRDLYATSQTAESAENRYLSRPIPKPDHQRRTGRIGPESTPPLVVPSLGVLGELNAIAERRAEALALWDGPIQALWDSLAWFQEQGRRLAQIVAAGNRETRTAEAWVRCMDTVDTILVEIGAREAEARAQVRGMDQFIGWAKQGSRLDAHMADQFRREIAQSTIDHLDVLDGRRVAG